MNKNQTLYVRVESCRHFIIKQIGCSDYSIECVDFMCGSFGQTYFRPQIYGRNQYDSEMFYLTLEFLLLQKLKSNKLYKITHPKYLWKVLELSECAIFSTQLWIWSFQNALRKSCGCLGLGNKQINEKEPLHCVLQNSGIHKFI